MRRALVACGAVAVCFGTAAAGNTRKVPVESDPPGASVYLNGVDAGAACEATPCDIEAPIGTTPIIVRKDGFNVEISEITVPKRGKIKPFKVSLTAATATVVITDPALKGGKILIDNVEKGNAPQRIDVDAGPHHVAVVVKGKAVADDILDLEPGDEKELKPAEGVVAEAGSGGGGGGGGGGSDDGEDDGGETPVKVVKTATASGPRRTFITVGADMDIGFRQFSYDHATNLAATESEVGQVMLGPAVELWPMEALGASHLRGLSIFGKVGFGLNHQPVLDTMNMAVGPTTFWGTIEVDVRHRWRFGEGNTVGIEGGFVRDQLQFNAGSSGASALDDVPFADYRSIRLGIRASTTWGPIEPFAVLEGRIVLSGGKLGDKFASADITGGRAQAGFQVSAGPLYVRAQGAITYYGWTFTNNTMAATDPTADGAVDLIEVLSLVVGLTH